MYLIDQNRDYAQVLAEYNSTGLHTSYSYGDDLISQTKGSTTHYYHYDGLGSTRALSDTSGTLTDTYAYDAFGELLQQIGTTENRYRFAGEQYDAGLDQYYLRARYYDQGVGRFTQMDIWAGSCCEPITLNKYLYGKGDPIDYIDPSGLIPLISLNISILNTTNMCLYASQLFAMGLKRQAGSLLQQMGKKAELLVRRIVKECIKPNEIIRNPSIHHSRRQLDLLLEAQNAFFAIEVKTKIPSYGSKAIKRLRDQLLAAQNNAGIDTIKLVGVEKISNESLSRVVDYLKRAGVNTNDLQIFSGAIAFAQWANEVYFEDCLEM